MFGFEGFHKNIGAPTYVLTCQQVHYDVEKVIEKIRHQTFFSSKRYMYSLNLIDLTAKTPNLGDKTTRSKGCCYVQGYCSVTLIRVNKPNHRLASSLVILESISRGSGRFSGGS